MNNARRYIAQYDSRPKCPFAIVQTPNEHNGQAQRHVKTDANTDFSITTDDKTTLLAFNSSGLEKDNLTLTFARLILLGKVDVDAESISVT